MANSTPKWLTATILLLFLISFSQFASAEPYETIRNNGNPGNRVDIIILGDGYTAAQMDKYRADAEQATQGFFNEDPYREYQRFFNVHRIDVISNQAGGSHPESGYYVDNALGSYYNCGGSQRAICTNPTSVRNVISRTLSPAQSDIIVVLVNDSQSGGAVYSGIIAESSDHDPGEVVKHEAGHSLGLLADEYSYDVCRGITAPEPNVSTAADRGSLKWNYWIDDPNRQLPSNDGLQGVPGAYEGARYCPNGIFRPTNDSKMRSLYQPFWQINTEQLIRRTYALSAPLDDFSPAYTSLSLSHGQGQMFSALAPRPVTHALSITWYVDGQPKVTGRFFALNTYVLSPGYHTVTAGVQDSTTAVRSDPSQLLTGRQDWSVYVADTAIQPDPIYDAGYFVAQHYHDFLDRDGDQGGLNYWTDRITQCGGDANCVYQRRIDVSAAFFVENEFQQTGSYVYRFYRASLGRQPSYAEFDADRNQLIGSPDLVAAQGYFADKWVTRPAFRQQYPDYLSSDQYVNALFDTAGLTPFTAERQQEISDMNSGKSRARVLQDVVEIQAFKDREYNPSFVLMQYFGYLRRDPDAGGYNYWLNELNNHPNSNYYRVMVGAFIDSVEYKARFGQV